MRLIGGLVSWSAGPVSLAPLRSMADKLVDADAIRFVRPGGAGFLHSTDLNGVESADPVWSLADLDLTNAAELRRFIGPEERGADLLTALYALEGPRFVRRLRGAFAFAVWDRRQRTLLLAVDHFGIRRLHYVTDAQSTAFASRPRALLGAPGIEGRVDPHVVYDYLNFGYVPAPASIFAGIQRLAPGCLLLVRNGAATLESYWEPEYRERPVRKTEGASTLYRLATDAVGRTLHDIPLKQSGAFLSGGTDSSTVVGLMRRITGEQVNAFSIGFDEERYNELAYAELAARHFGAAHHTHIVTAEDTLKALPSLIEAYDEPFGNNSAIGTFFCAQLARVNGVTRLLAGDGGDEIFGGNERYRTNHIFASYHHIPAVIRRGLLEPVFLNLPDGGQSFVGRAQRYIRRANIPNPRRFFTYQFFFAQQAGDFLARDFLGAVDLDAPYASAQVYYDRVKAATELNRLLYLDLKLAIGDNDLLKVTRTAELADINVRFPFLDLALVEFTGTLPARFKMRGLEKRYLFKRAFGTLLPRAVLRKRKHGFGVPTSVWLKSHRQFHEFARDTLLCSRTLQRGYFRSGALDRLFALHAGEPTPYYGDIIWTVLMFELWYRRHVDGVLAA